MNNDDIVIWNWNATMHAMMADRTSHMNNNGSFIVFRFSAEMFVIVFTVFFVDFSGSRTFSPS